MSSTRIIGATEKEGLFFLHSDPDMNALFEPVKGATAGRRFVKCSPVIRPAIETTRSA